MSAPLLDLRALELRLGAFRLGPMTLSLSPGDYLVLLGPSGCGKTTLLKAVAGLLPSTPGQLFLDGRDAGTEPPERRRVGYVSQGSDLFPHLDVAGNIGFGLARLGLDRAERGRRIERLAGLMGIGALLDRNVGSLSGGEAKRVALARALAVGPRLLLLDEPLGMLDEHVRPAMLETLRRMHGELGTAAVHVTHEREEAWAIGSRCAVMHAGRIEAHGPVGELFRRPRTRFVAEFLGGANVLPAAFELRAGRPAAVLDWGALDLDAHPGFERGHLLLRPEDLAVEPAGATGCFGAVVRAVHDRGAYAEVHAEVSPGNILLIQAVATVGAGLKAGDAIGVRLSGKPHAIPGDGNA